MVKAVLTPQKHNLQILNSVRNGLIIDSDPDLIGVLTNSSFDD